MSGKNPESQNAPSATVKKSKGNGVIFLNTSRVARAAKAADRTAYHTLIEANKSNMGKRS